MPIFGSISCVKSKFTQVSAHQFQVIACRQTHIVVVWPLVSLMIDQIVILRAIETRPQSINNPWIVMLIRIYCFSTGQSRSCSQLCPLQVSLKPWKCRVHLHLPSEGTRPLFSLGTLWTWTYLALLFVHYCPSLFTLPYELFFCFKQLLALLHFVFVFWMDPSCFSVLLRNANCRRIQGRLGNKAECYMWIMEWVCRDIQSTSH